MMVCRKTAVFLLAAIITFTSVSIDPEATSTSSDTTAVSSDAAASAQDNNTQESSSSDTSGQGASLNVGMNQALNDLISNEYADSAYDVVNDALYPEDGSYGYTNLGIANVESHLNIREKAKEGAKIIGTMVKNSGCEVIELTGDGWALIKSGGVKGYVSTDYLLTGSDAYHRAKDTAYKVATVNTTTLKVREEPSIDSKVVTLIPDGEELEVEEEEGDWVKVTVDSDEGYINTEYVVISFQLPKAVAVKDVSGVSNTRASLVAYAKQFIGNPYVWGGTSLTKGADCSGFVLSVYKHYGISLPHYSKAQANCGTRIKASQAQPGDLFFYGKGSSISHVAIYIGNGQVVHASSRKTGIKISNAYYRTPICVVSLLK